MTPSETPTANPTTATHDCVSAQNLTELFGEMGQSNDESISMDSNEELQVLFGVSVNISIKHSINDSFVSRVIDIISEIMHSSVNAIVSDEECVKAFDIMTVHSDKGLSIGFEVFVCDEQRQRQLRSALHTYQSRIVCVSLRRIESEMGVFIAVNDTLFVTNMSDTSVIDDHTNILSRNGQFPKDRNTKNHLKIAMFVTVTVALMCVAFVSYDKCVKQRIHNRVKSECAQTANECVAVTVEMNTVRTRQISKLSMSTRAMAKEEIESCSSGESDIESEINLETAVVE